MSISREYLTGFTKRKLERRKFGLAMQKVKDHQKKLEERRQVKGGPSVLIIGNYRITY